MNHNNLRGVRVESVDDEGFFLAQLEAAECVDALWIDFDTGRLCAKKCAKKSHTLKIESFLHSLASLLATNTNKLKCLPLFVRYLSSMKY